VKKEESVGKGRQRNPDWKRKKRNQSGKVEKIEKYDFEPVIKIEIDDVYQEYLCFVEEIL